MMKTLKIFLGLFLLCVLEGCESYTEDFGFYMNFSNNIYTTSIHAKPDSYSLSLSCPFDLQVGKMDISEAGFYYKGDKVVGEYNEDEQIVQATINQLPYNQSLQVCPYILTPEGEIRGNTASVLHKKEEFTPVVDTCRLFMPEVGKIRMEIDYRLADTTQKVTLVKTLFSEQSLNTEIQKEKIIIEFYLSDLTSADTKTLNILLVNGMGEKSYAIPYSVLVSEKDVSYADDGEKDDCMRICGIDWAKGNLMYDNGTWRLGKSQDETFYYNGIDAGIQNEFFSFGDVSGKRLYAGDLPIHWYTHAFDINSCSIKGDPAADVAAAHLPGWTLPSRAEFQSLINHASWQYGYTLQGQEKVYGVLFYTKSNKKVRSLTPAFFDSENLNEMGLFLPAMGIRGKSHHYYDRTVWYMSGDAYKYFDRRWFLFSTEGEVYHLEQSNQDLTVTRGSNFYSDTYQLNVRPVKGTVKEDSYKRELEVTEGTVVDLGLSVKWAASNVGASSPEQEGSAFKLSLAGFGEFDTNLWRMPSYSEVRELLNQCEWNWGCYKGVNGYQVKGPNGNSIFLPAYDIPNHVGIYRMDDDVNADIYDYIDILCISSQCHTLESYIPANIAQLSYYCLRLVSKE